MATKVLSIEIGQGLTRVVEMDYKSKNPKIYNCFTFETPQNVIDDGMVYVNDAFTAVMKAECEKRGIKTNQVVFSVNSTKIARRNVSIPLVKEKQIQEVITISASDYFPVDMTNYHLAYSIMEKVTTKEESGYKLNVLAVPNELTASYFEFAQSIGCTLVALDYVGNSVYQIVSEMFKEGVNVVIKIDEQNTMVTVIDDGKIEMQRNVLYGIEPAIETVRTCKAFGENLSYVQAIDVLCGKTCIRRYLNPDEDYKEKADVDKDIAEARIKVTESLRPMINMITRVLEYYASNAQAVKIEEITLIGLGADFSGLSKLLTNELNHKVRVYTPDKENVIRTIGDATFDVGRYAACMGTAMAPMNLIPEQKTSGLLGKKKEGKSDADAVKEGKRIFLLLVILSLLLAGIGKGSEIMASMKQDKLNDRIAELQPAKETYDKYVQTKANYEDFLAKYALTVTPNDELYAFIGELEEKMPKNIQMLNFAADGTTVTISANVKTKVEAAELFVQLRTFESLAEVDSPGITETIDDNGAKTVTLTVTCQYAQPAALDAPEEAVVETTEEPAE